MVILALLAFRGAARVIVEWVLVLTETPHLAAMKIFKGPGM